MFGFLVGRTRTERRGKKEGREIKCCKVDQGQEGEKMETGAEVGFLSWKKDRRGRWRGDGDNNGSERKGRSKSKKGRDIHAATLIILIKHSCIIHGAPLANHQGQRNWIFFFFCFLPRRKEDWPRFCPLKKKKRAKKRFCRSMQI